MAEEKKEVRDMIDASIQIEAEKRLDEILSKKVEAHSEEEYLKRLHSLRMKLES